MIIRVSNKDREILKDLSKYIWWQDSEYAINHNTLRLIASAMCLGSFVSSGSGFAVEILQYLQFLVQTLPIIKNVAVLCE